MVTFKVMLPTEYEKLSAFLYFAQFCGFLVWI